MSDDLVAQLKDLNRCIRCDCGACVSGYENHEHICSGDKGCVAPLEPKLRKAIILAGRAASALTEARAEIERLRAGINGIVNCQGPMTRAQVRDACAEILDNKTVGLDNQSPFAAALADSRVRATTMEISVKEAARSMHKLMTRAVAAESELSTLRARVREVVGAFGNLAQRYDDAVSDGWVSWAEFVADHAWPTETNCRAARQLMEDLK